MNREYLFLTPDDIQTFDYPGSTFTSLNGINKLGQVCGYYVDAAGITHGFLGKVNRRGSSKPNINRPITPVKPVYPSPEMFGTRAPGKKLALTAGKLELGRSP
jgi:hypothetical protein